MTDPIGSVVLPAVRLRGTLPGEVTKRGGDCRAFDRRTEREVYGPAHPFVQTTDVAASNGLLRFWVGNRGVPPFLNVQAFLDGSWREVGTLRLDGNSATDVLLDAGVTRCTPDECTVRLVCRGAGPILCTLRRGFRGFFVHHGAANFPSVISGRHVIWTGMPPAEVDQGLASAVGAFGTGLGGADHYVRFPWPIEAAAAAWSLGLYWLPGDDDASQADSGLLYIADSSDEEVASLQYVSSSKRLRFMLGAQQIDSPPLVFGADEPIFVALRFDTANGMALTTKPQASAIAHAVDASSTDPGTSEEAFASFTLGFIPGSALIWGSGDWGDGNWGAVGAQVNGVLDEVQLWGDRLTDAEAALLAARFLHALEDLPTPAGRLVWHASFDVPPAAVASVLASGRRNETESDGVTRLEHDGLTRALAGLTGVASVPGLGIARGAQAFEAFAFLATQEPEDDISDQHEQFAAACEQETRVR